VTAHPFRDVAISAAHNTRQAKVLDGHTAFRTGPELTGRPPQIMMRWPGDGSTPSWVSAVVW
jgi:hypothetical protein